MSTTTLKGMFLATEVTQQLITFLVLKGSLINHTLYMAFLMVFIN